MLSISRALSRSISSGAAMPRVPELGLLYDKLKAVPRRGEVMMVLGRSGTQKSGFALWYADQLNVPTLYFSGDMSQFTVASRIAGKRTGLVLDQLEYAYETGDADMIEHIESATNGSKIIPVCGSPITWDSIEANLDAFCELYDEHPSIIAIDNLMDMEGAAADYGAQMDHMQAITEMSRQTNALTMVLHHASDKTMDAKANPWMPPSRDQAKNGMSEKPAMTLGVALDPTEMSYRIACLKQRMGPCDPTGRSFVKVGIEPELTRFHAWDNGGFASA